MNNRTALGRFNKMLNECLGEGQTLQLEEVRAIGPFDNAGYSGLLMPYPIEEALDFNQIYPGRDGEISWIDMPYYNGMDDEYMDVGAFIPSSIWSTVYIYASIESDVDQIAKLSLEVAGMGFVWFNGQHMVKPNIPRQCNMDEDSLFVKLNKGKNTLLIKALYDDENPWAFKWSCRGFGSMSDVCNKIKTLYYSKDPMVALNAKYSVAEIYATYELDKEVKEAVTAIKSDQFSTKWDALWADTLLKQKEETGTFLPIRDLEMPYEVVENKEPCDTLWPQVPSTEKELFVLDTSEATPQNEFAFKVLQGIVNRKKPSLYITHCNTQGLVDYKAEDLKWLDELHYEGYTSVEVSFDEAWEKYVSNVKGAIIYDGSIMDEIGEYRSHMINQTNVLTMLASLEDAIPLTPEMNKKYKLPVIFDAREKWQSQFEMMQWAYKELYPKMNQTILATLCPGKFFLTDYLVAFKIFTFWFPERRTIAEENLLNGILASTPPNTPIIGWWFDWMPNPKNSNQKNADGLQEIYGLLHGSNFGKILTPSHEATNLTIHSGVGLMDYKHHPVEIPEYDDNKIYYTYMLSDGDNLGEALMHRTRNLHWDKEERGLVPIGWSFAPSAAVMAPTVLNYYMRTLKENDFIVGGLGVGYTEPTIYLRAYMDKRDELFNDYALMTDATMAPLDTNCLWLINGMPRDVDIYANNAKENIDGIFVGYGGSPEMAEARMTSNDVVAFVPATVKHEGGNHAKEDHVNFMVEDIEAAMKKGEKFIEAWVLNWAFSMDMLLEVDKRLGNQYVCVRPDVLVELKKNQSGEVNGKE